MPKRAAGRWVGLPFFPKNVFPSLHYPKSFPRNPFIPPAFCGAFAGLLPECLGACFLEWFEFSELDLPGLCLLFPCLLFGWSEELFDLSSLAGWFSRFEGVFLSSFLGCDRRLPGFPRSFPRSFLRSFPRSFLRPWPRSLSRSFLRPCGLSELLGLFAAFGSGLKLLRSSVRTDTLEGSISPTGAAVGAREPSFSNGFSLGLCQRERILDFIELIILCLLFFGPSIKGIGLIKACNNFALASEWGTPWQSR